MTPTLVDVAARGGDVSCRLEGEFVIPRLVRRVGRSVDVALVAGRAMLLPGDDVRIDISVGEGCELTLVDIGGLVVYGREGRVGGASGWHACIELADRARLRWDGLPTVITDAGALTRSLTVRLAAGASAILRETLVLGRAGERGGRVQADTEITDAVGPILRETLDVAGGAPAPGILGADRIVDTILAVGERAVLPDVPGACLLSFERGGSMLRHMGRAAHDSPLPDVLARFAVPEVEPARVS